MFDLNPVLARARLTYEWIQRDPCRKDDDWLPLSTREHFNTDVPAMVAELRAARACLLHLQKLIADGLFIDRPGTAATVQALIDTYNRAAAEEVPTL